MPITDWPQKPKHGPRQHKSKKEKNVSKHLTKAVNFALVLTFMFAASVVNADIFMKQKRHTDAFEMMGRKQPAQDLIDTIWITDSKIATLNDSTSVVVDLDKKLLTMIDHGKKVYREIPVNLSDPENSLPNTEGMNDEQKEQFNKMYEGLLKMTLTVEPTDETKKIAQWTAKKYVQTLSTQMGPVTSEIWATEELEMKKDVYAKFTAALLAMQPGMQNSSAQIIKELEKIKGVAVLTVSTTQLMGSNIKSSQELIEFKNTNAPEDAFAVPAGYSKASY